MKQKQDWEETREWILMIVTIVGMMAFIVLFACVSKAQSKEQVETTIREAAQANGIDADLALAIAEVESGMNPQAVGHLGEQGVFQLRPEFHAVIPGNTKNNANLAMRYLARLREACADYGDAYFICFNMGEGKRVKHPTLFPYYVKVQRVRQRLAGR